MTCPSSDVLNQLNYAASLPGGAPLSSDNQACYNLLNNDDAAYKRQYDSAGAGGGVSAVSLNPQPGTAPVPTSLIGSIFNLVGAGANAYQAMQLAQLKAHVQGTGAQLYAPPAVIAQAKSAPIPTWEYAAGAGLGLLLLVVLVVYMSQRD